MTDARISIAAIEAVLAAVAGLDKKTAAKVLAAAKARLAG